MKLLISIHLIALVAIGIVNCGFIYSYNLPQYQYYGASYALRYSYLNKPIEYIIPSTLIPFNIVTTFQGKHHHPDHHGDGTENDTKENEKNEQKPQDQQTDSNYKEEIPLKSIDQAVVPSELPAVQNNLPAEEILLSNSIVSTNPKPLVWPTSSQFHQQDNLGQYYYGYANQHSSKQEIKTINGITRGAYSYIDANSKLQTVYYIADDINGFRVLATNLPKVQQESVHIEDSPDVASAKIEHFRAQQEAIDRVNAANSITSNTNNEN